MGQYTLADFRTRLNIATANRYAGDNAMLDTWIHAGQIEVATAIELECLKVCSYVKTASGIRRYTLPTNLLGIITIFDRTNKKKLIKTNSEDMNRFDRETTGYPKYWARVGEEVRFWPVPNGVYEMEMLWVKEPDKMTLATDTTAMPATFDPAVHMFAVHHAKLDLGDDASALVWLERARAYMASRMMDEDYEASRDTAPVRIITDITHLHNVDSSE